jgi:hypothetical protein
MRVCNNLFYLWGVSMKDFFIWEDFVKDAVDIKYFQCEQVAKAANQKLKALIESWPVVYGTTKLSFFIPRYSGGDLSQQRPEDTHKARLALVEEIDKEPCKHEAKSMFIDGLGDVNLSEHVICKHCHVELRATWSAK